MARTPYSDPDAEAAYQAMANGSSQPSGDDQGHTYESDRLSDDPNTGNSMLRDRMQYQFNANQRKGKR